jgi:hypothetical protein
MKTLTLLVLMTVTAMAADKVIVVRPRPLHQIGGFTRAQGLSAGVPVRNGGVYGTGALNRRPVATLIVPADWREYKGEIYNVAVKTRYLEDDGYRAQLARAGTTANQVLPGWEQINGKLVSLTDGRAEFETSKGITVVTGFADGYGLRVGQKVRVYAHLESFGVYDYGTPIPAEEAAKRIAAKSPRTETNVVAVAESATKR